MSSNPPLLVNVKLGSEICTMEADSGASISVMSLKEFEKLRLHDYSVCPSNDVVKSVTGTEKVHSIVNIPVTVQGKVHRLELRLLDRPCPALFGRDWIVKTGISIDDIRESMNRVDYIANDHDETKCDDSGVNASLSHKMLSEKPALCDIFKPNNSVIIQLKNLYCVILSNPTIVVIIQLKNLYCVILSNPTIVVIIQL